MHTTNLFHRTNTKVYQVFESLENETYHTVFVPEKPLIQMLSSAILGTEYTRLVARTTKILSSYNSRYNWKQQH